MIAVHPAVSRPGMPSRKASGPGKTGACLDTPSTGTVAGASLSRFGARAGSEWFSGQAATPHLGCPCGYPGTASGYGNRDAASAGRLTCAARNARNCQGMPSVSAFAIVTAPGKGNGSGIKEIKVR
jgi:hypothetical protein